VLDPFLTLSVCLFVCGQNISKRWQDQATNRTLSVLCRITIGFFWVCFCVFHCHFDYDRVVCFFLVLIFGCSGFVVSTSASVWLERPVSKMIVTPYTHSLTHVGIIWFGFQAKAKKHDLVSYYSDRYCCQYFTAPCFKMRMWIWKACQTINFVAGSLRYLTTKSTIWQVLKQQRSIFFTDFKSIRKKAIGCCPFLLAPQKKRCGFWICQPTCLCADVNRCMELTHPGGGRSKPVLARRRPPAALTDRRTTTTA